MSDDELTNLQCHKPAKRNTRLTSKAMAEADALTNKLKTKRDQCHKLVKRYEIQINDIEKSKNWSKGEISERIKKLEITSTQLQTISIDLICVDTDPTNNYAHEDEEFDDLIVLLKAKLSDQIDALNKQNPERNANAQPQQLQVVEVQHTDMTGNVLNTWGTFNGDYAKWKSFHDRWMTLHENPKVKTIIKFQNLKTACTGVAEGALGEWDLTEENYAKAWDRLKSIYEDDYMQAQEFMRKLSKLPHMRATSSQSIRDVIDTVHKHIHGLKRYIQMDDKHPYVVFTVIERMDTDTYRAWEKYRPTLARPNAQDLNVSDSNNINQDANKAGKHIPTWNQLEQFLEGEVTIRVHAEKRSVANQDKANANNTQKRFKKFDKPNNAKVKEIPDFLQCALCNAVHPIFRCEAFNAMNLTGKLDHIAQHDLCKKCLRKNHNGPCKSKRCNEECPKCKPASKFHNSSICPNAELQSKIALLTNESGNNKRKHQSKHNNRYDAKKKRTNGHPNSTQIQSSVNKIGDWALMAKHSNAIKNTSNKAIGKRKHIVLVATINIRIQNKSIHSIICRAIADTGATLNCITARYVEENELKTIKCQKKILGVTGPEIIKRKLTTVIRPWFESDFLITIEFFMLKQLDGMYPHTQIEASKEQIMHLGLADENFDIPAPIDAILGAETYANIIGSDLYKHKDGAIMQSTSFGHIILGKFITKAEEYDIPILSISQNIVDNDYNLEKALSKFWSDEDINKCENKNTLNENENAVEKIFVDTYYREANGRYVVSMPISQDKKLGDSKGNAFRQFMQLEKRLNRDASLKQKYIQFMREYQELGYMKLASEAPDTKHYYYLPHHPVTKKFRIVYNGSAKTTNNESLNSIQLVGAKLQYDLQLQIMRFRRHKVDVATDISKMFNRVGLNPSQWNLHRIFWRESPNEVLKEYVLTVVTFGMASSTFNAVRALIQCARDYENDYPEASHAIEKCFYIDDGIFGCNTAEEAKLLCKEVEFVLNKGGFLLKGWTSNSKEVEAYMNAKNLSEIILGNNDEIETKILGVRWIKKTDEFSILVNQSKFTKETTKRAILSQIARLYDPNGFIAPVVITAKILMQEIARLTEIKWDHEVTDEIRQKWLELQDSLPLLNTFRMKRWLNTNNESKIQIHAFCDASEKAFGTAIYVRTTNQKGENHISLLSSKSRVAPLKKNKSIPRLELEAAVLLSEQLEAIIDACEFKGNEITLWSDSSVVIQWIKKDKNELKAFVSKRVEIIQEKTKFYKWKHVSSGDNPADLVSRGMKVCDFLKSKFWLEGPQWLKQCESNWPTPKFEISPRTQSEILKECKIEKAMKIYSGTEKTILYDKFQDWDKIINVTAYVLRFINLKCKKAKNSSNYAKTRYLSSSERKDAAEIWIKFEQEKEFRKEINCLISNENLPSKSVIASLRPILDANGLLRIGGRIDKANISYEKKHQYIIPNKSRLSYLLLQHAHNATLHGGAQLMMQFLRKQFWIPKLRAEARRYINTCIPCVRQAQASAKQIMSELPEVRIKPAPPFQNVGIDLAGPFKMRITEKINNNTRNRSMPDIKCWIVVFVCLVTRAVHLEPTEGMSSDDFLTAYQKFTGRRGSPEKIFSDNGTNLVGGNNELQKAFEAWKTEKIQYFIHLSGTKWHFITPSAPHEGGIWEAAVKSMKHHLKRVMGTQKYSLSGITALLTSVEACLNSRPLCKLSDDPEDVQALTPAHFLIGRPLKLPLHEKADKPPYNIKRLFIQLQFQIQAFWKQWSSDYLQSLMQTPKWREEHANLKIGQLVIIKSDNIPPSYWAMGKIIETHKGIDGKVRSVTLKTQTGVLSRSIRKLCVLPNDIELSYWS